MTLKVKLLDQTNFPNLKQNPNSRDKRGNDPHRFGFRYGLIHPREVKQGMTQTARFISTGKSLEECGSL